MSYFTAVLAREGRLWTVHDLDVDAEADLAELTVDLRAVAEADEPVLLLVEREDAWWAVVRVDGDEDPRVFVSDATGAPASPYGRFLDTPSTTGGEAATEATCRSVGVTGWSSKRRRRAPSRSTVRIGVRIDEVGLNATRMTTSWPVEIPPATPPV